MSKPDPAVSFITTCKGRLAHLQETLPRMVAQSGAEIIVVDYGCPQGTAAWVRANHPAVKVVQIMDDPVFWKARAANLGAAEASGRFLCFIDADMKLKGDLGAWITHNANEKSFYLPHPLKTTAAGTCVIPAKSFARVRGYDEAFRGWGGEDYELYDRLAYFGYRVEGYPSDLVEPIEHGDDQRSFPQGVNSLPTALRIALLYRTVKLDIARLSGDVPELETRRQLMEYIRSVVLKFESTGLPQDGRLKIEVKLGMNKYQLDNVSRSLLYSLTQPEHSVGRGRYAEMAEEPLG